MEVTTRRPFSPNTNLTFKSLSDMSNLARHCKLFIFNSDLD